MDYIIGSDFDGMTVLEFMKRSEGISRALCKHLKFLPNGIMLNGQKVTVRARLRLGDKLSLAIEDASPCENLSPVDLPIGIVYEDEDMVIPNKPPNMPTHPSRNHYDDTVANALAFRYREAGVPFVFRPVNRLDRNTSGLVLIARNRLSAGFLSDALRKGEIQKAYVAILCGVPERPEGEIETYMRRTADSIIVRENCGADEGGDYALTRYRVICSSDRHSLVLAMPLTGRTHQLRVHFAGIGCAILGDDLYGSSSDLIDRHALHAYSLTLPRPSLEEKMTVYAPLQSDMRSAIAALFGSVDCPELEEILNKG